ncbi:MAG TPA: hypothetical protein VIF09_13895 [Polyangiaceae bacterium]|jgi:hypothetical protein
MLRFHLPLLTAAVVALSAGCGSSQRVTMQDDFDLDLFGPQKDDLSTPYVLGAKFGIGVDTHDNSSTSGWTLRSSNPAVLRVSPPVSSKSSFNTEVVAAGVGHATLTVLDGGGHVVDSHDVDVGLPDRIELYAHGLLLAGESDDRARISQVQISAGGEGTFLVRYFAGTSELSGNGALQPTGSGTVQATTTTSSLAARREWLRVTATPAGPGSMALGVGAHTVSTVPVVAVDPGAVKSVGIAKQSEGGAKDGTTLYLFGRAFDAQGNDVYGASFRWTVNGAVVSGSSVNLAGEPADLLSYQYKSGASESVITALDGYSTSTTVHGTGGAVGSTAAVGCGVSGAPGSGAEAGAALSLSLVAAGLVAARRRRRAILGACSASSSLPSR